MYLLMLLATFMSAIYGYNLSARPDYDRDVVMKKAAAVIYRFTFQTTTSKRLLNRIADGDFLMDKGIPYVLPGDYFYANYKDPKVQTNTTIHTFYNHNGHSSLFWLRKKDFENHTNSGGEDYLPIGRIFYDGSDMATKVMCLDKAMYETGSKECEPIKDPSGLVMDTCCNLNSGGRYFISYRKMDPRWINRISGDVSVDFIKAINKKEYNDNIGVITWRNGAWQFRGKINFFPVYAKDMEKWNEDHKDTGERYPSALKKRTQWTLPPMFGKNYFKSKGSFGEGNICDNGCLFKIQSF